MKKKHRRASGLAAVTLACLLFCLPACAAGGAQAPEGYTFVEQPASGSQIVDFSGLYSRMYFSTAPEDLAAEARLVVSGKYLGPVDTLMIGLTSEIGGWTDVVHTKGLFEVETVYKGSYEERYLEAVYPGGAIALDKYMAGLSESEIAAKGYDKVAEKDRPHRFVATDGDACAELEPGRSYLLFLGRFNDEYRVQADKYGVLPMRDGKAYNYTAQTYESLPPLNQPE